MVWRLVLLDVTTHWHSLQADCCQPTRALWKQVRLDAHPGCKSSRGRDNQKTIGSKPGAGVGETSLFFILSQSLVFLMIFTRISLARAQSQQSNHSITFLILFLISGTPLTGFAPVFFCLQVRVIWVLRSTPQISISHQKTTTTTSSYESAPTYARWQQGYLTLVLVLERGPYGKPNLMTKEGFLTTIMEVDAFDSRLQLEPYIRWLSDYHGNAVI